MKLLLTLALMIAFALPALAQEGEQPAEGAAAQPATRGLAGPYLAARAAAMEDDFAVSADYYLRALKRDDGSDYLNDSALVALLAAGEIERATELTKGQDHHTRLASLVQRATLARAEDWDGLIALLDSERAEDDATEKLLDGMLRAWALLGAGKASDATAAFEALRKIEPARDLVDYHLGLSKALVGDYEGAAKLLNTGEPARHVMGAIAATEVLAQLDRRDEALAILDAIEGLGSDDVVNDLRNRLGAGEKIGFDIISGPRDGIAQVFLTFASLMGVEGEPGPLSLIHARLASHIAPDMADARLMVAQMLQSMGQFPAAEAEFDALRALGEMRPMAELARIEALSQADQLADAEKAARALAESQPKLAPVWIALGDLLRQQEKYKDAIPAYDKALALAEDDADARWYPLYARAITHERLDQFDAADADLREAIKLRPDNAQMLNYLGYSLVDRNRNLDEALQLIERAAELSPDDGYILDSLGWVYYRLGRYAEAVSPQERAVAQMSDDSLVNDHLGDIYWMVGRKREAEIQWRRALSFGPEDEPTAYRIRLKLERGLDAVLAEEEANGGKLPPPPEPEAAPKE